MRAGGKNGENFLQAKISSYIYNIQQMTVYMYLCKEGQMVANRFEKIYRVKEKSMSFSLTLTCSMTR